MAKQYTKELIEKIFIELAGKKPLNQISVSEIAREAQINRNTFYYYFEDIYALLSEILDEELKKSASQFGKASWEEGFLEASTFILDNKKAVYNIFQSVEKKTLHDYIFKVSGSVMEKYVNRVSEEKSINAKESDKLLISYFYQAALSGFVVKWIEGGMKENPEEMVYRIGKLFDGNIESSLRRSENY